MKYYGGLWLQWGTRHYVDYRSWMGRKDKEEETELTIWLYTYLVLSNSTLWHEASLRSSKPVNQPHIKQVLQDTKLFIALCESEKLYH